MIEHPFISVITHEYVPITTFGTIAKVLAKVGHEYVYGTVPPAPDAETVPLAVPKHFTLLEFITDVNIGGCVILPTAVDLHP